MPPADPILSAPASLPPGILAIPLLPEFAHSPLRINLLARKDTDPVAGHFVTLRTLLDAVVYLGCITDSGGKLHGYVEIAIQNLEGLAQAPASAQNALTNRVLDDRFARLFKAYDALDDTAVSAVYRTGYESHHPAPLFYNTDKHEMFHPRHAGSNHPWALCIDDNLLAAKSLPGYSSSLHRYFYLPADPSFPFIPITFNAPTNAHTASDAELVGTAGNILPLNAGGLMLIREYAPARLEAFLDLLAGGSWDGILSGRAAVHLDRLNELLDAKQGDTHTADGRLFLGKHGKSGRLIETYHLKLRILADCIAAVRALTAQTQRPFLNLTADSFQVKLDPGGGAGIAHSLPFLWTATADLVDPGDAISLKMEGSEALYFLRGLSNGANVYQPESVTKPASGKGTLRIRKILAEPAGMILEGTFATQERLTDGGGGPTKNDLVWLRAPVGSKRLDLFGHVEKETALAAGEWRFRTERQKLPEATLTQLKAAEGVPIPETGFDVIPLLASPCDLYSLAVLGLRALLVNHDTTLAIVTDELLSLARQVALEHNDNAPLPERIRSIFQADVRWLNSLGPQRLSRDTLAPQEALDLIPAELWFDTLAMLVRMLPAMGPDSLCRDFGDAPRGGMHKIFDTPLAALDTLLVRTRSLIVIDWRFNREIHGVLRKISTGSSHG